ncbi:N-acetylmuramoyl-L-alanine amidase [Arabiibacter massiliensis]|uniref:N-acetylmuramoyl-L-alanine amidase n=1 Tax=Arabiibacter massiliensis TaxID=1870985 RepID=UPI0009B9C94C|nr:N-acetylmuramoyl-L-alanine amidase [Arabiibacter massiliensis]
MNTSTRVGMLVRIMLSIALCTLALPLQAFGAEGAAGHEVEGQMLAEEASESVAYVYVDEAQVAAEALQNVAVILNDEAVTVLTASLQVEVSDSRIFAVEAETVSQNAVLFAFLPSAYDVRTGYCRIIGMDVTYSSGVDQRSIHIDLASDDVEPCGFEVVDFEVEGIGSLERMPEASEPLSSADATILTLGENGEMTEASSFQDAVDSAEAAAPASRFSFRSMSSSGASVVALDPGHGGYDSGATGYGLLEKDLNWKIANYCKSALEANGVSVCLTRSEDECPDLNERVERAVSHGAQLFVSIHNNSGGGTGAEVWYPNGSSWKYEETHVAGGNLADKILEKLSALGLHNRGKKVKDCTNDARYEDGSLEDYYTVIATSREYGIPGIIVEHAFIDRYEDAQKLSRESFLKSLGEADAAGILDSGILRKASLSVSPNGSCTEGDSVTVSVNANQTQGFKYNYCWMRTDLPAWQSWGHLQSGGGYASSPNITWTPPVKGNYVFWCDVIAPSGRTIKTDDVAYVVRPNYTLGQVQLSSSAVEYGMSIDVTANASGDVADLLYNYCWMRTDRPAWEKWGHIQTGDGFVPSSKISWEPPEPGTYSIWCDTVEPSGLTKTSASAKLTVRVGDYNVGKLSVSPSSIDLAGSTIRVSMPVSGATRGFKYNYCWMRTDLPKWEQWGHIQEGEYSTESTITWTPVSGGTYVLWCDAIDPAGKATKSDDVRVSVGATFAFDEFSLSASSIKSGQSVTAAATASGGSQGLLYNYCWMRTDLPSWQSWGHLQQGDDPVPASSVSWAPPAPGDYVVWCDVIDRATGESTKSSDVRLRVESNAPTLSSFSLSASSIKSGQSVTAAATASGGSQGLLYNYCWMRTDLPSWQSWGHLQQGDDPVPASSVSWAPPAPGDYVVWCDVIDRATGESTKSSDVRLRVENSPIMGATIASVDQMVRYYTGKGKAYPSSTYSRYGAPTLKDFCQLVYEEARTEGVRAEVLFCQAMHETGWLQFGNDVLAEQCNFGGLGAVGEGKGGNDFSSYGANGVRIGLRAQVQHLKAYASTEPLANDLVDVRFKYVERGSAPSVEQLSGKWASNAAYGISIAKLMVELAAT